MLVTVDQVLPSQWMMPPPPLVPPPPPAHTSLALEPHRPTIAKLP